jgi:hypothetical protein
MQAFHGRLQAPVYYLPSYRSGNRRRFGGAHEPRRRARLAVRAIYELRRIVRESRRRACLAIQVIHGPKRTRPFELGTPLGRGRIGHGVRPSGPKY